jgi:hypothetical protein
VLTYRFKATRTVTCPVRFAEPQSTGTGGSLRSWLGGGGGDLPGERAPLPLPPGRVSDTVGLTFQVVL